MMRVNLLVVWALGMPLLASVTGDIRMKISAGDLLSADAIAADFCAANPGKAECAAAEAWVARGALTLGDRDRATKYLDRAKRTAAAALKNAKPEDDSFLMSAVGSNIETEGRLIAEGGNKDKAVAYYSQELRHWEPWQIRARIRKNIDLLSLEGSAAQGLDPAWKGKPVLLFLWAHWCGDCRGEAPVMGRIRQKWESKGLVIAAPTRLYGWVGEKEHVAPEVEKPEVERVWKEFYPGLQGVSHPLDDEAMFYYGVSSTPTIVLIDRAGIVRMYRPSRLSEAELDGAIEGLMGR